MHSAEQRDREDARATRASPRLGCRSGIERRVGRDVDRSGDRIEREDVFQPGRAGIRGAVLQLDQSCQPVGNRPFMS